MAHDNPRTTLMGYLQARSHWIFAMEASEQPFANRLLDAADAQVGPQDPKVRVDWWGLHMAASPGG